MKHVWLLSLGGLLATIGVSAQTVLRPLPSQTHRLATAQSITLPIKCDSEGNVFLRFPSISPSSFDVVKIAKDGSQKATFRYYDLPEFKAAFVEDFAIANDGKVYELAQISRHKMYVLRFSSDGQLDSHTELLTDERVHPSQLVVLNNGDFFVSGSRLSGDARTEGQPFNFLFNSSGKFVRSLSLKSDPSPAPGLASAKLPEFNPEIRFGRALLGHDGYVYLMRATSPAIIDVISPAGELARTLKVNPPFPKGKPVALMMSAARLAIEFSDPDAYDVSDTTIRVVSAMSGETIADYKIVPELTEAVACYTDDEFTFLGNSDGWPAIMQASTR